MADTKLVMTMTTLEVPESTTRADDSNTVGGSPKADPEKQPEQHISLVAAAEDLSKADPRGVQEPNQISETVNKEVMSTSVPELSQPEPSEPQAKMLGVSTIIAGFQQTIDLIGMGSSSGGDLTNMDLATGHRTVVLAPESRPMYGYGNFCSLYEVSAPKDDLSNQKRSLSPVITPKDLTSLQRFQAPCTFTILPPAASSKE